MKHQTLFKLKQNIYSICRLLADFSLRELKFMINDPSLQRQHLFSKTLPLKCICCCTDYLMSRLICKKGYVFFLFPHETYGLAICWNRLTVAILTIIKNLSFFKVLNIIFLHNFVTNFLPLK